MKGVWPLEKQWIEIKEILISRVFINNDRITEGMEFLEKLFLKKIEVTRESVINLFTTLLFWGFTRPLVFPFINALFETNTEKNLTASCVGNELKTECKPDRIQLPKQPSTQTPDLGATQVEKFSVRFSQSPPKMKVVWPFETISKTMKEWTEINDILIYSVFINNDRITEGEEFLKKFFSKTIGVVQLKNEASVVNLFTSLLFCELTRSHAFPFIIALFKKNKEEKLTASCVGNEPKTECKPDRIQPPKQPSTQTPDLRTTQVEKFSVRFPPPPPKTTTTPGSEDLQMKTHEV